MTNLSRILLNSWGQVSKELDSGKSAIWVRKTRDKIISQLKTLREKAVTPTRVDRVSIKSTVSFRINLSSTKKFMTTQAGQLTIPNLDLMLLETSETALPTPFRIVLGAK